MVPKPKYPRETALAIARHAFSEGKVYLTDHFRYDRMEERNISMSDVEHLFETGTIPKDPTWDEEHENWEYVVKGTDIEGIDLAIVFAIDEDGDVHLITAKDA